MTEHQPQPKDDERDEQVEASQDDDNQLEDLEPEEDETTDVQGGGFRVGRGRGGGRNT